MSDDDRIKPGPVSASLGFRLGSADADGAPAYRLWAPTAQQVSQLPLERGEVALAVRVPPPDADPTSEIGRVGLALNHMLNNIEDALAARQASETKVRRFVADASHELRNPLAAIRGYAELTRRSRDEMPEDAAYAMSRVESEAERMSRLGTETCQMAKAKGRPVSAHHSAPRSRRTSIPG